MFRAYVNGKILINLARCTTIKREQERILFETGHQGVFGGFLFQTSLVNKQIVTFKNKQSAIIEMKEITKILNASSVKEN